MPDNVMHPVLRRDAEGQLTLTGIGYDDDWNELLVTYTLNADNAVGTDVALGCARSVG